MFDFELSWDGCSFYTGCALVVINGLLGVVWGALPYFGVYVNNLWLLGVGGLGIVLVVVPVVWRFIVPYPVDICDEVEKSL